MLYLDFPVDKKPFNPEALAKVLSQWLPHLIGSLSGEIVPIDGKSLRGSYDRNQGIKALHLVTAWAGEQKLVLGQVKVEDIVISDKSDTV